MTALAPPDRLPITPAGLVVARDGAKWVIAIRRDLPGYFVCRRTPQGLEARWRFRRWVSACRMRAELMREASNPREGF